MMFDDPVWRAIFFATGLILKLWLMVLVLPYAIAAGLAVGILAGIFGWGSSGRLIVRLGRNLGVIL